MVDRIVSHATYMAIGIIAIMMIISAVYGFKGNMEEIDTKTKLDYVAGTIENKILEFKSIEGDSFESKVKMGSPDNYLVTLSDNLITVKHSDIEVTRDIDMPMSGEQYLPAYLVFTSTGVRIE